MRSGKPFSALRATLALAGILGFSRYTAQAFAAVKDDEWRSPSPSRQPGRGYGAKGPRSRRRKHRCIKAKRRWKSG